MSTNDGAVERDEAQKRRGGRTPFRIELKFTPEEWRAFGERANEANRSRYNFAKRAVLAGDVPSLDLDRQIAEACAMASDAIRADTSALTTRWDRNA